MGGESILGPNLRGSNSSWARICPPLRSPGIESKKSIPTGCESTPGLIRRLTNSGSEIWKLKVHSSSVHNAWISLLSLILNSFWQKNYTWIPLNRFLDVRATNQLAVRISTVCQNGCCINPQHCKKVLQSKLKILHISPWLNTRPWRSFPILFSIVVLQSILLQTFLQ